MSVRADIINSILLYLYDCNENECESTSEVIATIISIMQNGFLKSASKGFLEKIEMKKEGEKLMFIPIWLVYLILFALLGGSMFMYGVLIDEVYLKN